MRISDKSGESHGKQGNVGNRVKVLRGVEAVNPKPFLTGLLEMGIITFGFGAKRIDFLERNTIAVNGKPVIVGKRNPLRKAAY